MLFKKKKFKVCCLTTKLQRNVYNSQMWKKMPFTTYEIDWLKKKLYYFSFFFFFYTENHSNLTPNPSICVAKESSPWWLLITGMRSRSGKTCHLDATSTAKPGSSALLVLQRGCTLGLDGPARLPAHPEPSWCFLHSGLLCPGWCRQDEEVTCSSHWGQGASERRWWERGSQISYRHKKKGVQKRVESMWDEPIIYISPSECQCWLSEGWIAY